MLIKSAQDKNKHSTGNRLYFVLYCVWIVAWLYNYSQIVSKKKRMIYMASRSVDAQFIVPAPPTIVEDTRQERFVLEEHVLAVQRNRLTADKAMRIAALFAVLSDPTRLQVVYALLQAPPGELCVGDLATGLGRDDTTISHQLRVLRNQQIVAVRKVGRVVYYRLVDDHVRLLLEMGMTHANEQPSVQSLKREVEALI
jgi:DNA-binding transcriptional ArsR family regulator